VIFSNYLPQLEKALRSFRKLSRRSIMTRPWREHRYKWLSIGEGAEPGSGDGGTENLITKALLISPPKWKMSGERASEISLSPIKCNKKTVPAILHKDLKLSKKLAMWLPKLLDKGMKKEQVRTCEMFGAMVAAGSLAMLDNVLTVGQGWRARWPTSPSLRRPPRRVGMRYKNLRVADFAEALQW
jgi:hypothetical protein